MCATKLVTDFLEDLKKMGKSQFTVMAYSGDLSQFEKFVQSLGKTIINITSEDLERYKKELEEKDLTPSTKARKIHAIKSFYKYLVRKGIVSKNIARDLTAPKVDLGAPRVLKKIEYMALREASRKDVKLRAIVEVLLQTGIRVGELVRLKIKDLQFTKSNIPYLHIEAFGSHEERTVPLPKVAYEALKAYLDTERKQKGEQGPDAYMFVSKTGKPMQIRNIRERVKKLYKEVGIEDATVNDLRNTFIMHHLKRGVSPVIIARMVGHKRMSTIERILRYVKDGEVKALKSL